MTKPLDGVRIADFSHIMAGPYATHLLCMMGAEVIKIEPPQGDNFRSYGADRRYDGMAPAFIGANAGKKSIALDLKDAADQTVARNIVESADVLVENFRPGVIARLGFGYNAVRAYNPDIIFCSVSGYGQTGALRDWPAIDNIVQATSGMMLLGGEAGDPPLRVGFPVVDTLTGQTAALAIVAALYRRQASGGGECIDVAMFDAALAFMSSAVVPHLVTGNGLPRTGNIGFSGQPTAGVFVAGDGRHLSLGVVQPSQFAALARHLGRADWLVDERYRTPDLRRTNADALSAELALALLAKPAAAWEAELSAENIPCGMVRDVGEAAQMPHLADRQLLLPLDIPGLPGGDSAGVVNTGFRMTNNDIGTTQPPPRLDEQGAELRATFR